MTGTGLTQQQINFFNTFGYLYFPGLLADCVDRITAEFERIWERHGGGHHSRPHDGKQRSCIVPFPDKSEYLSSLLDDPRIHDIAAGAWRGLQLHQRRRQLLRRRHPLALRRLQRHPNPQHQDRLLPGPAHRQHRGRARHPRQPPLRGRLRRQLGAVRKGEPGAVGVAPEEVPAVIVETEPGDIVVFWHNTKHSAFGGSVRRRIRARP